MSPAGTVQQPEIAPFSLSEGSRAPLFSPAGFVVLLGVMVVEAVVVYLAAVLLAPRTAPAPVAALSRSYVEVELGPYARELSAGDAIGSAPDRFILTISLVLNPRFGNLGELRRSVEDRKNLLKHLVSSEILHRLGDADLRKPDLLEFLAAEIRRRVNAELPSGKEGVEVVERVIFPESKLPVRR